MNIYIFGSIVRGEIDHYSDVDLLLIKDDEISDADPSKYSIYTEERIKSMFTEGNPFAWHLFYESVLVYSSGEDYIKSLGVPSIYSNCKSDLQKFKELFEQSFNSLKDNNFSTTFDLSMIFLAIRNFATCYSLGVYEKPIFARTSFEKLIDFPLNINRKVVDLLMMSRISSTRGLSYEIDEYDLELFYQNADDIKNWFNKILKHYESRIQ